MSASADKGDRKREIEQSPMKKKFKYSTISREDLDDAIANSINLALKEQQSTLNSVVASAVRDAVDSVLITTLRELREDIQATNKSVKELREELEAITTAAKQTRDRVDSVQAAAREDKRKVTDLRNQLERLTEKMTDMEDRSRRNNVRLVGLSEGAEGSNAAGFLRVNLSKWIPSLKGHDIEIDRAHRVYDGGRGSDRPRTLIFRVLRWHDSSEILKGARQAYPVKCAQDNVCNEGSEACGSICSLTLINLDRVKQAVIKQQRQEYQRQGRDINNTRAGVRAGSKHNRSSREQYHKGRQQRINRGKQSRVLQREDPQNTEITLRMSAGAKQDFAMSVSVKAA